MLKLLPRQGHWKFGNGDAPVILFQQLGDEIGQFPDHLASVDSPGTYLLSATQTLASSSQVAVIPIGWSNIDPRLLTSGLALKRCPLAPGSTSPLASRELVLHMMGKPSTRNIAV